MKFLGAAAMVLTVALLGCSGTGEIPPPTQDLGVPDQTAFAQASPTATPTRTPDIDATTESGTAATVTSIPPTVILAPTPVPIRTATPVSTLTPTPIPTPTPTPTPTPVPDPMVRVIYATPLDVEPNPAYIAALNSAIYDVQRWYADQLDGLTFAVQTRTPEHCSLANPADHYAREEGYNRVVYDLQHCVPIWWEQPYYVWVIYPDVVGDCELTELGRGGYGVTILHRDDLEGLTKPEGHTHCGYYRPHGGWVGGLAHELGHAFGLPHPPGCDEGLETCDWDAMMQLGYTKYPDTYLTDADVAALKASPWFYVTLTEQ